MINSVVNEFACATTLVQTASWFDCVDNAAKIADTNKRYYMSSNPSTSPSVPIAEGSFTNITISPQSDYVTDLYNSFLTAEIELSLTTSALGALTATVGDKLLPRENRAVWVGYKDSMDSIAQYQIIANGVSIYSQSNAIEESYITNCACTEEVKRADVFSKTRHEDVWNRVNTQRTGTLFDFADTAIAAGTTIKKIIPIKIDFRRFLPLSGIKYLPAFAGNIQLRVQFSPDALVYCPISPQSVLGAKFDISKVPMITNRFVPLGTNLKMLISSGTTFDVADFSLTKKNKGDFKVISCDSHLWGFGLDEDIYQALIQRYTNAALTFPIQTSVWVDMNGNINAVANGVGDLNVTVTPRFVDCIFMLFRKQFEYKTIYENPQFKSFILKMGAFQTVPQTPIRSTGPILFELIQNALNLNNDVTGLNTDVVKSLICLDSPTNTTGLYSNDVTNFFIALPTSLDNTFQQGQTSNSPVTYNFKYQYSGESPFIGVSNSQVLMGFLKDSVLTIQINPRGDPPLVTLDDYDITSPQESE
jgi:hypothetical protein